MRDDFRRMAESYNRVTAEDLSPLPAFGPNAPFALVTQDATLSHPEHAALRRAVLARYGRTLSLAAIG